MKSDLKQIYYILHIGCTVISCEIGPLAVFYPLALSGCQGRYAHAYRICASFYCMSLKNIYRGGGGYNAAWG